AGEAAHARVAEDVLDVEVEAARSQPQLDAAAGARVHELVEPAAELADVASVGERLVALGAGEPPHLPLRLRQRDLISYPCGVDVAPGRRSEAVADLVADVLLGHRAVEIQHDHWTLAIHDHYI